MSRLEKVGLTVTIIAGIIGIIAGAIYIVDYLGVPFPITISTNILWAILIASLIIVVSFISIRLKRWMSIECIEGVQVFLFFPKETPLENKTLKYHEKYFHHKLIINFNRDPPKAYFMQAPYSYGWKFAKKCGWVSEIVSYKTYSKDDPNFGEKWCKEHGYELKPWKASKEELLKTD